MAIKIRKKQKKFLQRLFWVIAPLFPVVYFYREDIGSASVFFREIIFFFLCSLLGLRYSPEISSADLNSTLLLFYVAGTTLFLLFFACWFIAPFVLPLSSISDWSKAMWRFILSVTPCRGPAIFVKEGKIEADEGELARKGPGVVFVDACSAVVIEQRIYTSKGFWAKLGRKETSASSVHAKAVGPGLSFFGNDLAIEEKVIDAVDLRKQVRIQSNVHAFTRDGIELKTLILTVFTLGQEPDVIQVGFAREENPSLTLEENWRGLSWRDIRVLKFKGLDASEPNAEVRLLEAVDDLDDQDKQEIFYSWNDLKPQEAAHPKVYTPPYRFDESRVVQAVYATAHNQKMGDLRKWTEIPGDIAVQVFRNLLSQKSFNELFYSTPGTNAFPLKEFKDLMAKRMKYQGVLRYQGVRPVGQKGFLLPACPPPIPAQKIDPIHGMDESVLPTPPNARQGWMKGELECFEPRDFLHSKVLRSRGIKLIYASFLNPQPVHEVIRDKFFELWKSNWEKRAEIIQGEYELQAMRVKNLARALAQQEMTSSLSRLFSSSPHSQEALAMRVFQALETAAADPETRQHLPGNMVYLLSSLGRWMDIDPERREPPQIASGGRDSSVPPPGDNLPGTGGV